MIEITQSGSLIILKIKGKCGCASSVRSITLKEAELEELKAAVNQFQPKKQGQA